MFGPLGTALNMIPDATEIYTCAVAELAGCMAENDGGLDEEILWCLRDMLMNKLLEATVEYSQQNYLSSAGTLLLSFPQLIRTSCPTASLRFTKLGNSSKAFLWFLAGPKTMARQTPVLPRPFKPRKI